MHVLGLTWLGPWAWSGHACWGRELCCDCLRLHRAGSCSPQNAAPTQAQESNAHKCVHASWEGPCKLAWQHLHGMAVGRAHCRATAAGLGGTKSTPSTALLEQAGGPDSRVLPKQPCSASLREASLPSTGWLGCTADQPGMVAAPRLVLPSQAGLPVQAQLPRQAVTRHHRARRSAGCAHSWLRPLRSACAGALRPTSRPWGCLGGPFPPCVQHPGGRHAWRACAWLAPLQRTGACQLSCARAPPTDAHKHTRHVQRPAQRTVVFLIRGLLIVVILRRGGRPGPRLALPGRGSLRKLHAWRCRLCLRLCLLFILQMPGPRPGEVAARPPAAASSIEQPQLVAGAAMGPPACLLNLPLLPC